MIENKKAGEISYKRMILTAASGEQADIQATVEEIHLFEDLFSNNMHGHLLMNDSNGFTSTFPVVGQETFTFEYRATGADFNLLKFAVYKVELTAITSNTNRVKLSFISTEAYVSQTTIISRAFRGNNSSIVKDVFDRYMGSDRPLIIDETRGINRVICPKWNPFYFINWLALRSIPANGSMPSFYFYETTKGYNFIALESLFSNSPAVSWKKQLENASQSENSWTKDRIEYNSATIEEYELLESNDFLYNQTNGMYSSEMYIVDYYSNGFKKVTFDYLNEFKKSKHLNPHPLITSRESSFGYRNETPGLTRTVFDNTKAYATDVNKYADWVLKRISFSEQLNGQRMKIVVPGNGTVKVGDIAALSFPLVHGIDDPIISGKYIISAIHHKFELTKHTIIAEVCKDSTLPIPKVK